MSEAIMPGLVALIGLYWLIRYKRATEELLKLQRKYINRGRPLSKLQDTACRVTVPAIGSIAVIVGAYDAIKAFRG
jgi:hypothetical protein